MANAGNVKRRLILLRHGKGAYDVSAGTTDKYRPLSERGREEAAKAAKMLGLLDENWFPNLVLSSDALRCRQTLDKMRELEPRLADVRTYLMPSFYEDSQSKAGPGASLKAITRSVLYTAGAEHSTVLCIGHNPGWDESASVLCNEPVMLRGCDAALLISESRTWTEEILQPGGMQLNGLLSLPRAGKSKAKKEKKKAKKKAKKEKKKAKKAAKKAEEAAKAAEGAANGEVAAEGGDAAGAEGAAAVAGEKQKKEKKAEVQKTEKPEKEKKAAKKEKKADAPVGGERDSTSGDECPRTPPRDTPAGGAEPEKRWGGDGKAPASPTEEAEGESERGESSGDDCSGSNSTSTPGSGEDEEAADGAADGATDSAKKEKKAKKEKELSQKQLKKKFQKKEKADEVKRAKNIEINMDALKAIGSSPPFISYVSLA